VRQWRLKAISLVVMFTSAFLSWFRVFVSAMGCSSPRVSILLVQFAVGSQSINSGRGKG
jgi:hypothetical protein